MVGSPETMPGRVGINLVGTSAAVNAQPRGLTLADAAYGGLRFVAALFDVGTQYCKRFPHGCVSPFQNQLHCLVAPCPRQHLFVRLAFGVCSIGPLPVRQVGIASGRRLVRIRCYRVRRDHALQSPGALLC